MRWRLALLPLALLHAACAGQLGAAHFNSERREASREVYPPECRWIALPGELYFAPHSTEFVGSEADAVRRIRDELVLAFRQAGALRFRLHGGRAIDCIPDQEPEALRLERARAVREVLVEAGVPAEHVLLGEAPDGFAIPQSPDCDRASTGVNRQRLVRVYAFTCVR